MKTRSAKNKGKRLQDKVADMLRKKFTLEEMDVLPVPSSVNGKDIWLSEKAKKLIGLAIECKNQEKLSIWAALAQAEGNKEDDLMPALVFSRNHSKIYVCIEFEQLLDILLLSNLKSTVIKVANDIREIKNELNELK